MTINLLKVMRERSKLTQADLAARAGVSRQMVGAIEAGRHLPRVDAALALAAVLETDAETLFGGRSTPVDALSGATVGDGAMVRIGRVGDLTVTAPVEVGTDDWGVADGVFREGRLVAFERKPPGLVVAGCEPGLGILERMLREGGAGAVSAPASTAAARRALSEGRLHAAVVHGPPDGRFPHPDIGVTRLRLTSWAVGLAAADASEGDWWRRALDGSSPVVQREPGAGVQRALLDAVGGTPPPGPVVATHLESARMAASSGLPAVTIEPAARAVGLEFHALEVHRAELWIAEQWVAEPFVDDAVSALLEQRFRARLDAVGGYDLSELGSRVS